MSLIQNAAVLATGQLVSRLFTFSLNQLLLAYTSPTALGVTQILDFILYYTFFLSREALRLTIAKLPSGNDAEIKQYVINYSYLSFLIYIILVPPIIYWKIVCNDDISTILYPYTSYHIIAFIITCTVLELLAESYYNINQYIMMDFKRRTKIESLAGLSKCATQFITVIFICPWLGHSREEVKSYLFGYVTGQLAYSVSLFFLYWSSFSFEFFTPKKVVSKDDDTFNSWYETKTWSYFKSIFVQQIFKNFLTIGDRFVITSLLTLQVQGYYSFISNYGSLIARIMFAPMEESTRITVSKLFADNNDNIEKQRQDFTQLSRCISNVSKIYIYFLTILVIFAPLNTFFLLNITFKKFISPQVIVAFKIYWFYLLLLALNGILEALFQSLFHSKSAVNRYSIFMFINSVIFLGLLFILSGKLDYGLNGLIVANMSNMFMRITYCLISVIKYIRLLENKLSKKIGINLGQYSYFMVVSCAIAAFQYLYFQGDVKSWKQFAISALCGCMLVTSMIFLEFILPKLNSNKVKLKKKD